MMRKYAYFAGAVAVVTTTTLLTALPAGAVTPATFTLTTGALSITSPTASVSLGSQHATSGLLAMA
jgi:hypothetical protein